MADTATTSTLRSGNDLVENNMTAVSTTLNQAAASVPSGSANIRDSGLLGFYHPYSTTTLTDNYTTTTTTTTSHERRVPAATTTLVDAAAAELVSPPSHTHETNRRHHDGGRRRGSFTRFCMCLHV